MSEQFAEAVFGAFDAAIEEYVATGDGPMASLVERQERQFAEAFCRNRWQQYVRYGALDVRLMIEHLSQDVDEAVAREAVYACAEEHG